jgi:hypothetical protein
MKTGKWAVKTTGWIVKMLMFGILAVAVVGLLTMTLWNWLVPELFHGPVISFWQGLGLLVLTKILFWTFAKRHHSYGGHWRPYWKEKWNAMSLEDRERFKQKMKDKWCYRPESTSTKDSGTSND